MRTYRFGLAVVVASLVVPMTAARADDVTVQQIFQHHETAVGYSLGDGKMKPFVMESTVKWTEYNNKNRETQLVRRQAGAYYRVDSAYADAHQSSGFDGSDFWRASPNLNVSADAGYSRTFDVTQAVIDSEAYGVSLSPQVRSVQRDDYVVRIHPNGGMVADVYFNRSSWLIDQTIIDPDDAAVRTQYLDYKQFGPAKFATTLRRIVPSDYLNAQVFTTHVNDVRWDAPITADDLSAPATRTYASFPASGTVSLPFDPRHHVIVNATINGVSGRFLIDTQADGIFVDSLFADKAHLKSDPNVRFDYDDPAELVAMPTTTVALGGLTLSDVKVGIVDLNIVDIFIANIDGVMGLDLLDQAVTGVDFDAGTVTFTKPSAFQVPAGMYPLPITIDDEGVQSIAMINGTTPLQCELAISDDIAFYRYGPGPAIDSVRLGPFSIDVHPPAVSHFSPDVYPTSTNSQCEIGFGVLGSMNMVIDYPDMMFYLTAAKKKR